MHRSSQHADVLDPGVTALLLVPVGRPGHLGLWHSRLSHSVHEVGDVLDPTSLVLIASPMLCSPSIQGSTVVAVRAVVRLGSVFHRCSSQLGSATMVGWSAPLLLTSRVRRLCVTCACVVVVS